jgi:HlyD family secretion protein
MGKTSKRLNREGARVVSEQRDRGARVTIDSVLAAHGERRTTWLSSTKVRWVLGLVALALLVVLARSWSGNGTAVRYVTEPSQRGGLTVIVTATGSVQPTEKVDVSSELSGTVRRVLVDYNSSVKAGDTLATLDTDKLKATVDSSRAKLAASKAKVTDAEATVNEKQRDLARKTTLSTKQITSQQDLDLAQAAYDRAVAGLASARADVGVAEADLKLNETNLAKATITSPIDGVVLTRNVDPGQTVAASLQAPVLFTLARDLKKMELQVDVDEADVGKVRVGQGAMFGVDAFPEKKFPAEIRELRFASETVQGVVTYKALLTVDNSELLLRPGMTATAEIRVTELKDVLLVANAALRYTPPVQTQSQNGGLLRSLMPGPPRFRAPSTREQSGPNRTVFVLREGVPVAVPVVVGASDGRRTEITKGALESGEAVIVDQTTAKP